MFSLLFMLFVGVPLVELWLLLQVGERVGAGPTIALVIGTGIVGANLARREGMRTIEKINAAMAKGQMPHEALLDGLAIFLGGTLLLTPGILTDVLGFSLLFHRPARFPRYGVGLDEEKTSGHASVSFYQTGFDRQVWARVLGFTPKKNLRPELGRFPREKGLGKFQVYINDGMILHHTAPASVSWTLVTNGSFKQLVGPRTLLRLVVRACFDYTAANISQVLNHTRGRTIDFRSQTFECLCANLIEWRRRRRWTRLRLHL